MSRPDDYRTRAALLQLGRELGDGVRAIAAAIATLGEGIAALAVAPVDAIATALTAEEIGARSLDVEHLGRWVLIPGRPNTTAQQRDRAGITVAGRLVGLEPGEYPTVTDAGVSRTLILLQGGKTRSVLVPVDAVVRVGAREWS